MQLWLKIRSTMIRSLEWLLMLAVVVLVFDVLWGVLSRYLLGEQSSWTEELAKVLLIWVVLLGAAVAYHAKAHLGLDYFVDQMTTVHKRLLAMISEAVVFVFAAAVLVYGGGTLVLETLHLEQMMMALGIEKGYVYLAVPFSGVFFCLFALESFVNQWRALRQEGEAS